MNKNDNNDKQEKTTQVQKRFTLKKETLTAFKVKSMLRVGGGSCGGGRTPVGPHN